MNTPSKCPKRVLGTGINGEYDLGDCIVECAAFHWPAGVTVPYVDAAGVEGTLCSGICREYDEPVCAVWGVR